MKLSVRVRPELLNPKPIRNPQRVRVYARSRCAHEDIMKQPNLLERAAAHSATVRLEQARADLAEIVRTAYARAVENPGALAEVVDKFRQDSREVFYDVTRDLRNEHDRRNPQPLKVYEPEEPEETHDI